MMNKVQFLVLEDFSLRYFNMNIIAHNGTQSRIGQTRNYLSNTPGAREASEYIILYRCRTIIWCLYGINF